jgi:triacylglycerol lipase
MPDVILVSGGAAVSPFTTPDDAAATGLAAGNSLTALREDLLAAGARVFTAPARIGEGTVAEDAGWQGFSDVPIVLPAEVTINAVGSIDDAGERLHAFLRHLAEEYGVTDAVLVGHSMGGLFARAAIRRVRETGGPIGVRGLVTIGTPWTGSLLGDRLTGALTLDDAHGDAFTARVLTDSVDFAHANSQGAAEQVSVGYLTGADGWNARQSGMLDRVPVTVIAGDYCSGFDAPDSLWPHDALVAARSASARDVPPAVLPDADRHLFPDVHSIFFAEALGLPWQRALTWDPEVLATVRSAAL